MAAPDGNRFLEFTHVTWINGAELTFWRIPGVPGIAPAVDAVGLLKIVGGYGDETAEAIFDDVARDENLIRPCAPHDGADPSEVRALASFGGALRLIGRLADAGFGQDDLADRYVAALIDAIKADELEGDPPADVADLERRAIQRLAGELIAMQPWTGETSSGGEGAE